MSPFSLSSLVYPNQAHPRDHVIKKINVEFDSDERLKDNQTREIHNLTNELKVVEYVIARLIQRLIKSFMILTIPN